MRVYIVAAVNIIASPLERLTSVCGYKLQFKVEDHLQILCIAIHMYRAFIGKPLGIHGFIILSVFMPITVNKLYNSTSYSPCTIAHELH